MLPWAGHYINLDRSPERRRSIERQLANAGVASSYSRFRAIDGTRLAPVAGMSPAELGCFRSHAEVLAGAKPGKQFIHVLEDDAILSPRFPDVLMGFIKSGAFDNIDLIFTDVFGFDLSPVSLRKLKTAYDAAMSAEPTRFSLIDLKGFPFGGANSYLVNTKSLRKVLMAVNGTGLRKEKPAPIDLLYRREIGVHRLTGACVFPFISSVNIGLASTSTVGDRTGYQANNLLRHAFYVDCDLTALRSSMAPLVAGFAEDTHLNALTDIHKLMLAGPDPVV